MDDNVAQAFDLIADPGADPLVAARACETLLGFIHARQLAALRELSEEEPAVIDPTGVLCDPAPAEIACALTWTPATASRRLELAHDLHDNLPAVLQALGCGQIDLGKAQDITDHTLALQPETRAALAGLACTFAITHTRGQLRAWLARQVADLDPDAAEARRKTAIRKRRVWLQPESDGMATLGAYLTAEEAQACLEALRLGVANHEGGVDAARADLFVHRLTGIRSADPVPVQVLITPTGPEIPGYGPISAAHADQLCTGITPIRLDPPAPSRGYRPAPALTRYVQARDRHCRFPGCRRPAVMCDIDHTIAYPIGLTSEQNLACLCRYHHRIKTHTDWTLTRSGPTLHWTSPRGHLYTTHPHDP